MQSTVIMAFRKRLFKRGYRDISIKRVKREDNRHDVYLVSAVEPLAKATVSREYSIDGMHVSFR